MKKSLWKDNKFRVLLIAEIFILSFFVLPFFRPLERYEYDYSQMQSWSEYGKLREDGFYICESDMPDEKYEGMFTFNPFYNLRKGSYRITINYKTDTELNTVRLMNDSDVSYNSIRCDDIMLSPRKTSMTFNAYLTEMIHNANVVTNYGGKGELLIQSAAIERTRDMDRSDLVTVLFFITLFNVIVWLNVAGYFKRLSREQIQVFLILSAAVGYLFYPFCVDKLIEGSDMFFHLMRIESVKDSILAGELFPKIHPTFLEGYGYATGVFYPDALLYFPAVLRLIGFSIQRSYKIYLFAVNIGTCVSAYFCLREIVKNRYIATLGTVMYLYAPFRLFWVYCGHAVGTSAALMFVPFVVLGLYRIYTMDVKDADYKYSFILPTIGYAGLISTHILTTEMVGAFTIILCLILVKKTLRRETFLVLLTTVIASVILCLGFIVPFFDYYLFEEFKINTATEAFWGQQEGLQLSQLLQIFSTTEPNSTFSTANNLVCPENAGVGTLILAGVFAYAWFMTGEEQRKKARPMWVIFWMGMAALFLTTCYFPWDATRRVLDKYCLAFLVDSLQVPTRFMQLASFLLIIPGCYGLKMLLEDNRRTEASNIAFFVMGITLLSSGYMINHALVIQNEYTNYDLQRYTQKHTWSLEEYLPQNTDLGYLTAIGTVAYDDVQIDNYNKKYLDIRMNVANDGNDSYVDLPLLYYRGYRAVTSDGAELGTYKSGNNNVVRVDIPSGFFGDVHVYFCQPVLWRIAEIISIISVIGFMIYVVYCKKKKCHII